MMSDETQSDAPSVPASDDGGGKDKNREAEDAEYTATKTVSADVAENTGVSQEAHAADTVLLYYQTMLDDRLGSLFECERLYIYWETDTDYKTVFNTSIEHQLITDSGAYDVSAKLIENSLIVDDGWIRRKNPGMVVKVVGSDILGEGIQTKALAAEIKGALLVRAGWSELDAAKNKKVLILSEDLLKTQAVKTAAAIYLAKAMYPVLFESVDPDEALKLLTAEERGKAASGIFVFEN